MQVRTVTLYQVEMTRAELDLIAQVVNDQRESYGSAFRNVAIEFVASVDDINAREYASQPVPSKPVSKR